MLFAFVLTLPGLELSQWGYCKYNIHLQTGTLGQWALQKNEAKTIWLEI